MFRENEKKSNNRKRKLSDEDNKSNCKSAKDIVDNFSFLNYKSQLNRILSYNNTESSVIITDLDDLWLFIKKYEDILRKTGKSVISKPIEKGEYSKLNCVNQKIKLKFYDVGSNHDCKYNVNDFVFKPFCDIVDIYVDFKNKEKFNKLKKLRQAQADLPVAKFKDVIIKSVKDHQVVVIAGDTGCGKSTQVPQYLSEAGFKSIACTQPRRIACISLAKRVAYESLSQYGTEVGYQIRFEKSRTASTKICFITEGLLLRQISTENCLSIYDVIILDEIHERHLHGDFLLGVLKCLIQGRPDLKLVLMSATINIKLFEEYFTKEEAVVVQVPGRLYPIELIYKPIFVEGRLTKTERLDPQPYVQIMQLIDSKYPSTERGDLLIFLSGIKEITAICDAANQYAEKTKKWVVLPLHSSLSIAEQDKVFDYPPDGVRKCIVSTNIAETSVTIDGIRFVVDSGKVKEMSYDPSCKMHRLKEFWISKASAEQRKGRAGRTGPGVCYRIYSENDYSALDEFTTPEIARVPLDSVVLLMTSLGLNDVRRFPFIDPPPKESVENAVLELKQHGALTSNEKLTPLGKSLANLPVDVPLAKALVISAVTLAIHKVECGVALAAVLGVQNPLTSKGQRDLDAETARKPDESDHGDPLTLLSLYCAWLNEKSAGYGGTKRWCLRRGIEEQRFYEVTKLAAQFRNLLQDAKLMDAIEPEKMSSAERSIKHGQMKQLKDMRRKHKQQAAEESKKKKRLKVDTWQLVDSENDKDDAAVDIRDIEFRLMNDAKRIHGLISGASASSGRDLMTLKIVLGRAIYPQVAVADEFNHCKSVSEQLFHTSQKSFVALHPTSYFGRSPRTLLLEEADLTNDPPVGFKSKLPLSSKHQILCYLSLLETTKAYLMNTMRMPAAQTLLLLAHTIDTNAGFTRMICDSWLMLEFPFADSGLNILLKATKLRERWDRIINQRLEEANPDTSLEGQLEDKVRKDLKCRDELQYELSCDLATFLNSQVHYTIKRLLPADLKVIYAGPDESNQYNIEPNPFSTDFECQPHDRKGGIMVSEHIVYNCIIDTDWSYNHHQELSNTPWTCQCCQITVNLSPLERVQHVNFTCSGRAQAKEEASVQLQKSNNPNAREFTCAACKRCLHMTPVEILKHKKSCEG